MRTGRLSIARGGEVSVSPKDPAPVALLVAEPKPAPDPHLVEHRIVALERLARLREQGVLSAEEMEAEKTLVLRLPSDELVLHEAAPAPLPGPSLAGRMLRWQLLPAGLAAGLALSWWAQPVETMRLADQLFRLLGA